ncbi:MAG TPA: hypothetical protein VER96_37330 [Polyangiaceae bacterium]|nr:hypothetical protein [Polyangiaceae bacterium]
MRPLHAGDDSNTEFAPPRAAAAEAQRSCVVCGEPIAVIIEARPEYCFVCAVHTVCACADEPETR